MLCTAVFGIMNNYSAIVVDRNSCCLCVCLDRLAFGWVQFAFPVSYNEKA